MLKILELLLSRGISFSWDIYWTGYENEKYKAKGKGFRDKTIESKTEKSYTTKEEDKGELK